MRDIEIGDVLFGRAHEWTEIVVGRNADGSLIVLSIVPLAPSRVYRIVPCSVYQDRDAVGRIGG